MLRSGFVKNTQIQASFFGMGYTFNLLRKQEFSHRMRVAAELGMHAPGYLAVKKGVFHGTQTYIF